jgi:ribosome maturation factor RimP
LHDLERIGGILAPSLTEMGYLLVRITFGGGGRPTLQIMAEPSDGRPMTVEDCAQISRMASALLDVEDPISVAYILEVSSPGIDRPLLIPDDYRRFAGFEARIELRAPRDGRKRFQGRIDWRDASNDDSGSDSDSRGVVLVKDDAGDFALPFDEIAKGKLLLTDELIAANQEARIPPPRRPVGAEDRDMRGLAETAIAETTPA